MKRSSGILCHITSLPSAYGIGTMGKEAYRFLDFLRRAKQHYWQILPVNPSGYGDSPYQAFSTFAGNPYLIDLDLLAEQGLLKQEELESVHWGARADQVDFQNLYHVRPQILRKAFDRYAGNDQSELDRFIGEQSAWLPEYALFMAVKAHFGDGPWTDWPTDIRLHRPKALAEWSGKLERDIRFHCFLQLQFHKQWQDLRAYAHENGIQIIGDIPIYVPLDSADVWAHPELFQLTRTRRPKVVAGCPPDDFQQNGQYWGNPIYDWQRHEAENYSWWMARVGAAAARFDVLRIDHFRGIESYWSIPARNKTARNGSWVKGPGLRLVHAIQEHFPELSLIAEDLGFLTPEVRQLVKDSGLPGMKILQFAFDPEEPSIYLPHLYDENCVCYTGTHDNETLLQWVQGLTPACEAYTRNYLKLGKDDDLPSALIRAGQMSKAMLLVNPIQDYLRLGPEARMNFPGVLQVANWRWRMLPGAADDTLARKIAELTESAGRA